MAHSSDLTNTDSDCLINVVIARLLHCKITFSLFNYFAWSYFMWLYKHPTPHHWFYSFIYIIINSWIPVLFSVLQYVTVIIYFDTQIVLVLVSWSLFKLASVFCWHVPITLQHFPTFYILRCPRFTVTFSCSSDGIPHISKASWFLCTTPVLMSLRRWQEVGSSSTSLIDPDKEMSLPNWFTFPVDRTHSACFGKTRKFRLHIHLAKDRVIQ